MPYPQGRIVTEHQLLSAIPSSILLDNIRIAFLVFNSRAEVLHANPSALKLIASRDWLWIADNRLKHHGKQPPELGSCINTAPSSKTVDRKSTMILESSKGDSPLLLSFSSITSTIDDPVTLCTMVDPAANFTTNVSALRDVYSLTEAEINIISLIAGGKDYKQIASERNVTVSTVRSFTKSIFKKLGVGSRAGVIHKVQSTSIQLSLLTD